MLQMRGFVLILVFTIFVNNSLCQHSNTTINGAGKSYYFRIGKNNNEFRVNNRVHFLNHNITDYDYTYKRVENTQFANDKTKNYTKYDTTYFIDEEWNFDHQQLNKTELPLFIQKLYERTTPDIKNTQRILFNINRNSTSNIMKFNLNSLKPDETVLDADLYFFWPLDSSSKIYRESVVLRLYQFEKQLHGVLNETTLVENPDIHKLFNVIYISKAQRGWQIFKIKKPIDNWMNGEHNLGLLLTISSYDDNQLISLFNDTNEGIYRSFALVTVQNNITVLPDPDTENQQDSLAASSSCKTKEWTISFKKLHWDDFIVSPDGFMAHDCSGKCISSENDQINHVKLLRVFNKRASCCIPVDYQPLPIMFYDRFGNVVIKNYENMIVTKCGCR